MAQILGLPKLSPTMEEGVLVKWTKKEGDKVSPGDLVAEVETDKANMDFNVEDEGVLLKLLVKEGETVKLGAPVAILGKAGEDVSALVAQAAKSGGGGGGGEAKPAAAAAPAAASRAPHAAAASRQPPAAAANDSGQRAAAADGGGGQRAAAADGGQRTAAADGGRRAAAADGGQRAAAAGGGQKPATGKLLASPLAKSLAIELGVDLRTVTGTGPGGRIVERDVKAASDGGADARASVPDSPEARGPRPEAQSLDTALAVQTGWHLAPEAAAGDYEDIPASNMRKRIAARLTEAKRDVPHFYLQRPIDAAPLAAFRQRLNDLLGDRGKVSVNDLVIKAVALALRRVPECNASWEGDAIRRYHRVHVGVAVAIEDGLVTPVVRDADQKGIGSIAAEVRDLADRAKKRALKGHEITGSTFTVSNLGMFGIERFTAILNPPEAGILAVGAVLDAPIVQSGAVVAGKRMTVSMSCDHRVIDGATGARWLQAFAELLEKPESLAL